MCGSRAQAWFDSAPLVVEALVAVDRGAGGGGHAQCPIGAESMLLDELANF